MARNVEKDRETRRRYRRKKKIEKYGEALADVDMRGRHGNHARGAANARWNNGRMRTSHGYIAVKVPEGHHLRQAHGYAYEHQLVAERTLGRRLVPDEQVHHINGDKLDNRPENLEVLTISEHAHHHWPLRERDTMGRFV